MKTKLAPHFLAAVKSGTLELSMYDMIGADFFGEGITAKAVKQQMDAAPFNQISVRINSPGGDAFEGVAIGNLLKSAQKPVHVFVDGLAASAASIIAMCGDSIDMAPNAIMMVHNAWSLCAGDGNDMRKMADTLDKVSASIAQTYAGRTGKSLDEVKALMDAETWMNAEESLALGFATSVTDEKNKAAMAMASAPAFRAVLEKYTNVPDQFKADGDDMCDCACQNCVASNCMNCTAENCSDEDCMDCPMQSSLSAKAETAVQAAVEESNLSLYEARLRMLDL